MKTLKIIIVLNGFLIVCWLAGLSVVIALSNPYEHHSLNAPLRMAFGVFHVLILWLLTIVIRKRWKDKFIFTNAIMLNALVAISLLLHGLLFVASD